MSPLITGGADVEGRTRVSFITSEANRYRLEVATAVDSGEDVRVVCNHTTLFGGFNTFAADYNFLEIRNVSNAPISGYITVKDFAGTDKIHRLKFTIPAGRRQDFDLHSSVGKSYGSIRVTHDGPFKALRGRVSYYTIGDGPLYRIIRRGSTRLHTGLN